MALPWKKIMQKMEDEESYELSRVSSGILKRTSKLSQTRTRFSCGGEMVRVGACEMVPALPDLQAWGWQEEFALRSNLRGFVGRSLLLVSSLPLSRHCCPDAGRCCTAGFHHNMAAPAANH